MAKIFPTLENIERLKVKPTEGEQFLINYLIENLDEQAEIYFQPFVNGDMPDIILIQKNIGVTIIEVKDWNLNLYKIDEKNNWYLRQNNALLKSPFQQVYSYKNNLFNLHINGLLEEKIKNPQFYGRIQTYVYFHKESKREVQNFYDKQLSHYKELENKYHNNLKYKKISVDSCNKQLDYLKQKKSKIQRDLNYSIGNDILYKIKLPNADDKKIFKELIYLEFKRYLQPPYHVLEQGKELTYTKKQERLSISADEHKKIKGVAGSGKTVVLAKRAVNAHKRYNERVLILTYNLTLKSYIHDKISDVRENFSWGNFYITNYHQFVNQLLNNLGIKVEIPDTVEDKSLYFEKNYYSNIKLFENYKDEIPKYHSIFIDEIQDYLPEWIKIIRAFFLEENGEMVLFGDEKQNIYERELDVEKKPKIVQGFGRWEQLNKSIRHQGDGGRVLDLAKKFQKVFFIDKYEIDNYENEPTTPSLNLGIYKIANYSENLEEIVESIGKEIKRNNIHPNDVAILCSKIEMLKEIDFIFRKKFNEKTLTTFETKEMAEQKPQEVNNIRKKKKIGFNLNNGMLKISTIHSFKGYEASTIFLIIDEYDNAEMIYAGLTRSKFDIMVFTKKDSNYNEFFTTHLEKVNI